MNKKMKHFYYVVWNCQTIITHLSLQERVRVRVRVREKKKREGEWLSDGDKNNERGREWNGQMGVGARSDR